MLPLYVIAGFLVCRWHFPPARYPELSRADWKIEERLRSILPAGIGATSWPPEDPAVETFAAEVKKIGPKAALPLLRLAVGAYEKKDPGRRAFSQYPLDRNEPFFWLLAELRSEEANAPLFRMLADREMHPEGRRGAAIALAWPGNTKALPVLVERALDRQEDDGLRKEILYRLPRLEVPAPPELRALLHEPFAKIDIVAASTLARMVDREGLWLVREAIAEGLTLEGESESIALIDAASVVMGRPATREPEPGRGLDEAGIVLRAWIEANPDSMGSEFARERKAYLGSERRKRELAIETFEGLLAAKEEDIDIGSAALLLAGLPGEEADLERLDRLAAGLRKRIAGLRDPEEKIGTLCRWLFKERQGRPAGPGASLLGTVLLKDSGNCLGYATLLLALGERLDLPLRAVAAPDLVFVRWDDGKIRRNIDVAEGGRAKADEEYARDPRRRIARESIEKGAYLANLTRKEFLGLILVNIADGHLRAGDAKGASALAEKALLLAPKAPDAFLTRAMAAYEISLDDGPVLADLGRFFELDPAWSIVIAGRSALLRETGRIEEALKEADRAEAVDPEGAPGRAQRARCLSLLGRHAEAEEAIATARARNPEERMDLYGAALEVAVRKNPWWVQTLLSESYGNDAVARIVAARALLEPARGAAPDPVRALKVLEKDYEPSPGLRVADASRFADLFAPLDLREADRAKRFARDRYLLQGRAFILEGDGAAARSALLLAEEIGPVGRELRKLRRDVEAMEPAPAAGNPKGETESKGK
jgi:regulator of sirC expression with transglutaminase-like and TPR domain